MLSGARRIDVVLGSIIAMVVLGGQAHAQMPLPRIVETSDVQVLRAAVAASSAPWQGQESCTRGYGQPTAVHPAYRPAGDVVPQQLAGRVNGIAGFADGAASMAATLVAGTVADADGWTLVFFGFGLFPFLAMASLFLVLRKIEMARF